MLQTILHAIRKLVHAPTFTAAAVLTLALGIGATTAMFSIVYGVLLKPLPYADPARLMQIASTNDGNPTAMSAMDFQDYRARTHSFTGMAAMDFGAMNLTRSGALPARLHVGRVSASFFDVLGVRAVQGRTFAANEEQPAGPRVVVLSESVWRNVLGGDSSLVGGTITLDGEPFTVIGIVPGWMSYPEHSEAWVTLYHRWELDPTNRGAHDLMGIGRLAPGVEAAQAERDLATVGRQLAAEYPETNARYSAGAWPLRELMVQNSRRALEALLAAVGFVLLVVCANVANLQLAQAAGRETELAVRTALGAARWQIVRQLLTESLLLSAAGAAAGVVLARWLVEAVRAFGPSGLPRLDEVNLDARVVAFAVGLALITGVLFGLAPAIHASRGDVSSALRAGNRGSGTLAARRLRNALVVLEAALAVVLLVGAGLFLRSFARLVGIDPGFQADRVTTATISLPGARYGMDKDVGAFGDRLLAEVRGEPGVSLAAIGFGRPLAQDHIITSFEVRGWPPSTPTARRIVYVRPVSDAYFQVLGVPLVAGRGFTAADRAHAPQVMMVSREFVRRYFQNESALGKFVTLGWDRDSMEWGSQTSAGGEIVGVVPDMVESSRGARPVPFVYLPFAQAPVRDITVLVRSPLALPAAKAELISAGRAVDPGLPVVDVTTMGGALSASVAQPRFYLLLLAAFGLVGLLLAALGIYGVISYGVSARVREIGIRLALGATRRGVMGLTMRQGVLLALIGVPIGLAAAWSLSHYVATLLFETPAADWVTFLAVSVVLLGAATLASYIPARRAALIDPAVAMRAE
ncbi:MAG TPA: ABC transporter permease [Gemmatimonadales bacterium]|nr:ABC transporter permease [Gemmatimonadales bacterium]